MIQIKNRREMPGERFKYFEVSSSVIVKAKTKKEVDAFARGEKSPGVQELGRVAEVYRITSSEKDALLNDEYLGDDR
jgi:hypothetical protein